MTKEEKMKKTVKLEHVIQSILHSILQSRVNMDCYSKDLAQKYEKMPGMEDLPIPRIDIPETNISLKFAIDDLDDAGKSKSAGIQSYKNMFVDQLHEIILKEVIDIPLLSPKEKNAIKNIIIDVLDNSLKNKFVHEYDAQHFIYKCVVDEKLDMVAIKDILKQIDINLRLNYSYANRFPLKTGFDIKSSLLIDHDNNIFQIVADNVKDGDLDFITIGNSFNWPSKLNNRPQTSKLLAHAIASYSATNQSIIVLSGNFITDDGKNFGLALYEYGETDVRYFAENKTIQSVTLGRNHKFIGYCVKDSNMSLNQWKVIDIGKDREVLSENIPGDKAAEVKRIKWSMDEENITFYFNTKSPKEKINSFILNVEKFASSKYDDKKGTAIFTNWQDDYDKAITLKAYIAGKKIIGYAKTSGALYIKSYSSGQKNNSGENRFSRNENDKFSGAQFLESSGDGNLFALATSEICRVYDAENLSLIIEIKAKNEIKGIIFSHSGNELIISCKDEIFYYKNIHVYKMIFNRLSLSPNKNLPCQGDLIDKIEKHIKAQSGFEVQNINELDVVVNSETINNIPALKDTLSEINMKIIMQNYKVANVDSLAKRKMTTSK